MRQIAIGTSAKALTSMFLVVAITSIDLFYRDDMVIAIQKMSIPITS